MADVALFVPAYRGQVAAPVINSILQDYAFCARAGHTFGFLWHDVQPVDRARNLAVDRALTMGVRYLMSYDSDSYTDPSGSALERLMADLEGDERAVASSAVTVCRGGEILNAHPARPDRVYPAEKVGAAIMLIDLQRLSALGDPPWFRFELALDGVDIAAGEDVYFCNKVRGLGGVVLANYQIPTRHDSVLPLRLERFHVK